MDSSIALRRRGRQHGAYGGRVLSGLSIVSSRFVTGVRAEGTDSGRGLSNNQLCLESPRVCQAIQGESHRKKKALLVSYSPRPFQTSAGGVYPPQDP